MDREAIASEASPGASRHAWLLRLAVASAALVGGCGGDRASASAKGGAEQDDPAAPQIEAQARAEREAAQQAEIDERFPLHGVVTGTQLRVRAKPDPDASVYGWLRVGSRVRLAPEPIKTRTCASGFYRVHPTGWACAGEGIEVAQQPPKSAVAINPPPRDAALPYRYYFVKEPKVPEYHRAPLRSEQRAAREFVVRYLELADKSEERAQAFLRGELEDEIASPKVVRRYLDRGFFVAGAGLEERDERAFVRTVRGTYVQRAQLIERSGSEFRGVELGKERTLPVAWAVRAATSFVPKPRGDGSLRLVPDEKAQTYERLELLPWVGEERIGTRVLHKLENGRYLKYWFAAVAKRIARPGGIAAGERWVHVDLEQQTLVLYVGDEPVYATLVSSGLPGHETPSGLFTIRRKLIADTMADLGPEAGDDRYRIEDVPWTQYFSGSIALHGAFWHERFGLRRSHGCVNLAPYDAHRVFNHTLPELADGWHGVSTDETGFAASKVYVTEN